MGKNLYERRKAREASGKWPPPVSHSLKWHEHRVLRLAEKFSEVFVTTAGYGGPVARAAGLLNDAVEQMIAVRQRTKRATEQVSTGDGN